MRNSDYFDRSATLWPDRTLLVTDQGSLSYQQMQGLTHRLAGAMLKAGLKHQEAVAILSPNHPSVVAAMLSLWRAGGVWIPVNTRNALADNIAYLNYVRAGWLFYHSSLSADAEEVRRQMCTLGTEAGRIGQERLLVRARLRMSSQPNEWASDQLHAVVTT